MLDLEQILNYQLNIVTNVLISYVKVISDIYMFPLSLNETQVLEIGQKSTMSRRK